MKIYTKTGDGGSTALISGERVSKYDLRVEAYGSVDELSAVIAHLYDSMDEGALGEYRAELRTILNTLMNVGSRLAKGGSQSDKIPQVSDAHIAFLEGRIDDMGRTLKPISNFCLPCGHPLVSLSHICRTVCRRAERRTIEASRHFDIEPNPIIYLNRLSDYLFQLGRSLSCRLNAAEEYWNPDA